jgi:hypothetical protein
VFIPWSRSWHWDASETFTAKKFVRKKNSVHPVGFEKNISKEI